MVTEATRAQIEASTPNASSWVSANAGSGKTSVLTNRVARLLLSGTDPRRILCLTYTKAAAAEMQNRLFRTLGQWAMLEEAALRAALSRLGEPGETIPVADLDQARTLFARALETPGGLKIQTIHAFCDALLRRFPLEAGISPLFTVLEDRQAQALREEVLDDLAEEGLLQDLAPYLSGDDPDALLREITHNRAAFAGPFDPDRLAAQLGATGSPSSLLSGVMLPDTAELLQRWLPILAAGGANDIKLGNTLASVLVAEDPDRILLLLEGALLTSSGAAPYTAKIDKIPAKAIRAAHPDLTEKLNALMSRVESTRTPRLAYHALARSSALNRFARGFLERFDARKRALGRLDFDDLIARAGILLERPETAAWVLYRLDGGLDHILVDEAQDTSPTQWRIIKAISAEFFAGEGPDRTIFVVGDEKQSIYSFQGADPVAFGDTRRVYAEKLAAMNRELRRCDLLYSFRSAPPILALVDAVFTGLPDSGFGAVTHLANNPDLPGRVELWPFLPKPGKSEPSAWDDPIDALPPDDPVALLANRIAATLRDWLDRGLCLPGTDRPIRAGDVLLLVQRRGELFEQIIRALKQANVPVAGADVLRLGEELAVKDLLAALRFAATPADDLSLAAFLRGPMGGVSEQELFTLAHDRPGTLWAAFRGQDTPARLLLSDLLAQADYLRPYELLQRMLIRHGGRRLLIARLGPEAEDPIDALLDQALAYESVEAPSLTGFLSWIDHGDLSAKRRQDDTLDQVRVMTTHGAKGLEAPIVILPDTATRWIARTLPDIVPLASDLPAWQVRMDQRPPALEAAHAELESRIKAENLRLLYVALTRARSWLIVCGAGAEPKDDAWHCLVEAGLRALDARSEPGPDGPRLLLDQNWTEETGPPVTADLEHRPALRTTPPPAFAAPPPPLSPSGLGGPHALPGETTLTEAETLARGDAIHRLLETLRDHPPSDWPAHAAELLPDRADRAELLAEAAAVLTAPELAHLFGPDSLAEVDVTADLPGLGRILGRIDRLVIAPDHVLALDFKSNRALPARPDDVPDAILRQMGAYQAALTAIWPDRRVETAILWTREARLMPLPASLTAAALARAARERGDGVSSHPHLDQDLSRP